MFMNRYYDSDDDNEDDGGGDVLKTNEWLQNEATLYIF